MSIAFYRTQRRELLRSLQDARNARGRRNVQRLMVGTRRRFYAA